MGGLGKAIGGALQGIASIAQVVAPIADIFMPGLGRAIDAGARLVGGAGSFISSLDQKAEDQRDMDRRETLNSQAARDDMAAATRALAPR